MNIVIRVDSSLEIGVGHVMRCLTLAEKLNNININIIFVCRNNNGSAIGVIESKGYTCLVLKRVRYDLKKKRTYETYNKWLGTSWQNDASETIGLIRNIEADMVIVDHYGIDYRWESTNSEYTNRLMVIDDIANRRHVSQILVDQNYYEDLTNRYENLVPDNCKQFVGLKYLLLRGEFEKIIFSKPRLRHCSSRLLIFFGGNDSGRVTLKVLKCLLSIKALMLDVRAVVGENNPDLIEIKKLVHGKKNFNLSIQVDNMASLMNWADFSILSGGSVIWEACSIGLPVFTIVTAKNQVEAVSVLDKKGIIKDVGWHSKIRCNDIKHAVELATDRKGFIRIMSHSARVFLAGCCSGVDELVNEILG